MSAAALSVGVGLKLMTLHATEEIHTPDANLFCFAVGICCICIYLVRASHKSDFQVPLKGSTTDHVHVLLTSTATTTHTHTQGTLGGGAQDKPCAWVFRMLISLSTFMLPIGVANHTLGPVQVSWPPSALPCLPC